MGIGYLVLYAALALVAVWLTAELLLQNRASVVWRATTLAGFLGVVAGMRTQSLLLIAAGAGGFAVGQALVTRSVKAGATDAWSLRRPDGSLPGPLARIPLLSAATSGVPDEDAVAEAVPRVGSVGQIEPEEPGAAYAQVEEIAADDGVHTDQPVAAQGWEQTWTQQPQPAQASYQDAYGQQQYVQQGYAQQWDQQQYAYGYQQDWSQQAQPAAAQAPYQDAYGQQQYAQQQYAQQYVQQGYAHQQDPYAAQQAVQQMPQQAADQQYWAQQAHQQPQPVVPQPAIPQQVVHQQTWDHQQQG